MARRQATPALLPSATAARAALSRSGSSRKARWASTISRPCPVSLASRCASAGERGLFLGQGAGEFIDRHLGLDQPHGGPDSEARRGRHAAEGGKRSGGG